MFTGLVQALGRSRGLEGMRLVIDAVPGWDDLALGESIAVDGVCLTSIGLEDGIGFDLSQETLDRTSLGALVAGAPVNLERAMRPMDRFGGHIVQGHVDRLGQVVAVQEGDGWWTFTFDVGAEGDRYLIDKGSICLNGVSLTVVSPVAGRFDVAVIPHTYAVTSLSRLKAGDSVNVEFDVLAKHVEKLLSVR